MLVAALLWPSPAAAATTLDELQTALCANPSVSLSGSIDAPGGTLTIGCAAELDLHGQVLNVRDVVITGGHQLTIKDDSSDGDGSLTANASSSHHTAGIRTNDATLVIEGGTVLASGGWRAAGIGGQ